MSLRRFKILPKNCYIDRQRKILIDLDTITLRGQSKKMRQNRTGPGSFDSCFCVIFNCYDKCINSGREAGH